MLMFSFLTFILIFNSLFTVIFSNNEGSVCQISKNIVGKCTLLLNCPTAIANLKTGNYPVICGFQENLPIVCCQDILVTTSTISEQTCSRYGRSMNFKCGSLKESKLEVFGGDYAAPFEFPHMALIGYGGNSNISWECGGSLISERFVLTAAHCLQNRRKQDAQRVRLGDLNIKDDTDDAKPEEFNVIQRIKHPDYLPLLRYHDIALLKLDRDVTFNAYIRPACLHTENGIIGKEAIAAGWGNLEYTGSPSDDLMRVTLDIFDHAHCNNSYKMFISSRRLTEGIIDNIQICAGGYKKAKDTCQGDSGGPLQIYNPDLYCMYNIVGVTSFGKVCGVVDSPGVYTRVSAYVPWIESIVWT